MTDSAARVIGELGDAGFDLSARLQAGWYNSEVATPHQVEDFGRDNSEVVLIGNSRAIWPPFIAALRDDPELAAAADPMDRYTERAVALATRHIDCAYKVRWVHRAEPAHLSFQTLAQVAGLAWRSPASLSVHSEFGPWIALRAAIVLDRPFDGERPSALRTCHNCAQGCEAVLRKTLALTHPDWQDWLAVRDACPTGAQHRYSEHQLQYHYTRSRACLSAAISSVSS
ncbi:MAG: hypothetical protein HKN49_14900 [Gammaproteobacteria bacterium]|nr:hypothetical protein [Gammaproteobacteria bacterium]